MIEPLLVFRGIEKNYSENNILRNVDISLYSGKCILLSGNNGSGKTTLLKIIAGLEKPSRAEIEFSGKSQSWKNAIRSIRRGIIYLHQHPYLLSGTVESNVSYGLRFTHLNRKQLRESVKEALEWAGLSDMAKKQAKTLSRGVQQRVAFTRAWILKPKILLLDEPLANMDVESREWACDLLKRMKSDGMSIIITSHDTNIIDGLIDSHFSLSDGKLD
tara:strand:- start:749 stop:1399 length:651 start_codon:yes stop_codon:yes gene_type:complete